jgi:hypothetical protein
VVIFGQVEAQGLLVLAIVLAAAAAAARGALKTRGLSREAKRLQGKIDDFEDREEVGRLRHRDFDAFLAKLNLRRARLGQEPLTREYLEPHRYNLMYSVDAGDVDEAALEALRKRVGKAARQGDEVKPEPPAP